MFNINGLPREAKAYLGIFAASTLLTVGASMYATSRDGQIIGNIRAKIREQGLSTRDFQTIETGANLRANRFTSELGKAVSLQRSLDSLKVQGQIQKAYHQGQQAVRDSLKAAQKVSL